MIKEKLQAFSSGLSAPANYTSERMQLRKARLFSVLLLALTAALFIYTLVRRLAGADAIETRYLFAAIVAILVVSILALLSMHRLNRMEIQCRSTLMEKEERYRSLVENISEAIFTLNTDGYFTYLSPAAERISQYDVKDIVGQHFSRLVHPDDLPIVDAVIKKLYSGINETMEFRIFDKDSKILYIRASGRLITENGQTTALTGLLTNIT
ncbi:MAG: hypothetical protein QG657_5579, partial [Acidobacteriota bacterium]|nr:hypothetical protein [Acidobacteriota bacterium]